jgi:hypothetical protein
VLTLFTEQDDEDNRLINKKVKKKPRKRSIEKDTDSIINDLESNVSFASRTSKLSSL